MSYLATKTNYVRPHAKASYIRPMFCHNEKENMHEDFVDNFSTSKNPEFLTKDLGSLTNSDSLKNIDGAKEKNIESLSSAHSKLHAEIDKIYNWSASVKSECKEKDKKVDELNQKVESQRKILIDLQLKNENLSTKFEKEIQQRVSVIEKFYFIKEIFCTLRKKSCDLQGQFDACCKVKKAVDVCCEENVIAVEDLTKKMNTLSVQYSEKFVVLANSLKNERNNNMTLKKLFEQKNLSSEKEHKSLCKLIENYQEELKNMSKDLESEKNKALCLEQEKNDLLQKIAQLEKCKEDTLEQLKDIETQLQLTMEKKLEIENKYSLETIKVNDLNKQVEELEELLKMQKNDFEEKCSTLQATVNSLESSLFESKQKLVECESEKENLSRALQEKENEKNSLKSEILVIQKENNELKNKLIIDAKIFDESMSLVIKEKNDLIKSLNFLKEDLQTVLLDKDKLSKACSENDKRLSEMSKEYDIAAAKVRELSFVQEKYVEMVKKVEEMESDLQLQTSLLASKEMKIQELIVSEEKLSEALIKIKDLETDLSSKNGLLVSKEMKIKELIANEEKLSDSLVKLKDLESELSSMKDHLDSKEMKIKELIANEEKLNDSLVKLKDLESELSSMKDHLDSKEMKIKELIANEEKLNDSLVKLKDLESELSSMKDHLDSKDGEIQNVTASKLHKFEFKSTKLNSLSKIETGFSGDKLLKSLIESKSVVESDILSLKQDVRDFICAMVNKIIEKSPIKCSVEQCIEKLNRIKQNYDLAQEIIKEKEDVIKQKTELLHEKDEKIIDLTRILEESNLKLEKFEYENLEIKECLEKEKESVKICLECDLLKDQVKELGNIRTILKDTEKELNQQKFQTSHITKMLHETEEHYDEMRIKKEKEIIVCKDTIQSLQHELKILKVELNEAEKLRYENEKLQLIIEDVKLQNAGDIQRLKAEIESLKAKANPCSLNPDNSTSKKLVSATPDEKVKKCFRAPASKIGEVMEADSSDEVTVIEETSSSSIPRYTQFSKEINRKVINQQIHQSTPLANLEKRKRAWESESSGSECLEIIFDKSAKKVAGFTPKGKSPVSNRKTINLDSSGKFTMSQDKRRDLLEITDMETPKKDQGKLSIVNNFVTPQNKKVDSLNNLDLSCSKSNIKEINFRNSPWREPVFEIKKTPATPIDRKFFKTPLKEREREQVFKKPQLQKLWF